MDCLFSNRFRYPAEFKVIVIWWFNWGLHAADARLPSPAVIFIHVIFIALHMQYLQGLASRLPIQIVKNSLASRLEERLQPPIFFNFLKLRVFGYSFHTFTSSEGEGVK